MSKKTEIELLKVIKIPEINTLYKEKSLFPVTYNDIIWNGGQASATSIVNAIDLAEEIGEITVTLWDYNNVNHPDLTFTEARDIAKAIAVAYRNVMYERNDKIKSLLEATSVEDFDNNV
jgi:hypothetical protein